MKKSSRGTKIGLIVMMLIIISLGQAFAAACGDVNSSGTVDIVDALLIAQQYVGLNPSNFDATVADVNADSSIDIVDALRIAQVYVGLGSQLTCSIAPTGSISIACGSSSAVGSFLADQYYTGGSTYNNTNTIDVSLITSNPPPAALFNNERYGALSYTIPGFTSGGTYAVTLYFVETYLTSSGGRLFNVSINGTAVLTNFDIYATAGAQNKAVAEAFTTTANGSGQVVIQLTAVTENPKINGISIQSGTAPTPGPTGMPTTAPTAGPTGSATVNGNQVIVIGESFIAMSHEITKDLETYAKNAGILPSGQNFIDNATSGMRLAGGGSPTIPQQYANGNTGKTVKWTIMDGGGNDCLGGSCSTPPTSSCTDLVNAANAARTLLTQMGNDGVLKVVYFWYPDPQQDLGGLAAKLAVLKPMIQSIVTSSTKPKCYWLELAPYFAGHYSQYIQSDGIHPTSAGCQAAADAIWSVIQQNNFFSTN
jgi:hypothetical protein